MAAIDGFRGLTAAQTMEKLFPNARYIRYAAATTQTKEYHVSSVSRRHRRPTSSKFQQLVRARLSDDLVKCVWRSWQPSLCCRVGPAIRSRVGGGSRGRPSRFPSFFGCLDRERLCPCRVSATTIAPPRPDYE